MNRRLSLREPFSSVGSETEPRFCREGTRKKGITKMIHRKWSLLTGPAAILGGIVATVVVANFIFVKDDPFLKPKERKPEPATK